MTSSEIWHWRGMRAGDLAHVVPLADALFPDHPEDAARFAERLALGGDLCLTLADAGDRIAGYAVAYPYPLGGVPPLNRPLGVPPESHGAIYLHDLAVRPDLSGAGHARAGLARLIARARARGATTIALVAVNESAGYWRARGFVDAPRCGAMADEMADKLASYGADARHMVLTL